MLKIISFLCRLSTRKRGAIIAHYCAISNYNLYSIINNISLIAHRYPPAFIILNIIAYNIIIAQYIFPTTPLYLWQ